MKKLYIDANDKYVGKVVVYADAEDNLYYDSELTEEVEAEDMFHLFVVGVIASKDGVFYAPTSCTEAGVITFPFPQQEAPQG